MVKIETYENMGLLLAKLINNMVCEIMIVLGELLESHYHLVVFPYVPYICFLEMLKQLTELLGYHLLSIAIRNVLIRLGRWRWRGCLNLH